MSQEATSVRGAVAAAERVLAAAGVPSPRYDAEELAAHVLGIERRHLVLHAGLDTGRLAALGRLVRRRVGRVPLQHLTGRAYFRHLVLAVGPGVFVPRPETELVAGAAIDAARCAAGAGRMPVVVDLGAGCGAIALSIAQEVPGSQVYAVEADDAALAWAQRNLVGSEVHLIHADMADFADFATAAASTASRLPSLEGEVDVVVSNPPYIPVGALIRDPEVVAHDPPRALWSGADGLMAIRAVERTAARLLRTGGVAVVEHADLQGKSAPEVFRATGGWVAVTDHEDLTGRPRYLMAERSS
jgi:release factor glutamine methyltransferase